MMPYSPPGEGMHPKIRESRIPDARNQANRLLQGKETYQAIESKTGVPWWFAGLCHYANLTLMSTRAGAANDA